MKELDFDELDKAVNSLMTEVPKDVPSDVQEKTVTIPASDQSLVSSPPAAAPPAVPLAAPLASTAAAPALRRSGRFMDVVRPAAAPPSTSEPSKPVSRQGATIAAPAVTTPAQPVSLPSQPPMADSVTAATTPPPTHPADWPDPLDVARFKATEATATDPATPESVPLSDDTPMAEAVAPLTSPFLPDTKVEKRPLGGAPPTDQALPASPVQDDPPTKATDDDQVVASPVNIEPALPEELHGDLVAIESGAANGTVASSQVVDEKAASGPVSISQQYREEPTTSDTKNGSIYDTSTYHQPLAHPGKKKSGWAWVIWIVLILLIGAGIGAALYFFKIVP